MNNKAIKDTGIILVEYVAIADSSVKGIQHLRFVADDENTILNKLKELRNSFEEEYPADKYPDRKFWIVGVYKEMISNYTDLNKRI